MARHIHLPSPADFPAWRSAARQLLQDRIPPDQIVWSVESEGSNGDLFAENTPPASLTQPIPHQSEAVTVPRAFIQVAETVICHSADDRFALLYRLLWRLQREKHLLEIAADADVQRFEALAKSVRRDKHKMTAFVRFREVTSANGSVWIAWFEPQHHIVEATAPFFVRRFTSMSWSILTPRLSAHWDGATLRFSSGANRSDAPSEDDLEDHWRIYFSSIFNPARLNTSAMQREMPKKYWKNMPETALIPDLVRSAISRTNDMLQTPPPMPRVSAVDREADAMRKARNTDIAADPPDTLGELTLQLNACRRCPLWRDATQAVPGGGLATADIMIVGEQPGDQEDVHGEPFVGPAGKILDRALMDAGLPRAATYITNAVKHFKFEPRGKRRLHKKPDVSEIDLCRWWLANEIKLINPKLIIALGATAARSLLQRPVKIGDERGRALTLPEGPQLLITVHPSYLLRLPDPQVAEVEQGKFVADLKTARREASRLGVSLDAA